MRTERKYQRGVRLNDVDRHQMQPQVYVAFFTDKDWQVGRFAPRPKREPKP